MRVYSPAVIALANHRRRRSIRTRVLGKLRDGWGRWRESQRQYQLERALYRMNGGHTGPFATDETIWDIELSSGTNVPRVEAPKGQAPPSAK
jgi:hypothetical protein